MIPEKFPRRTFLRALGLAGGAAIFCPGAIVEALAATGGCPGVAGRNVHWIVPFSAGGGYDTYSRLIGSFYEDRLGAEIAVENVTGAGGIIGAKKIQAAAPDGLTIGLLNAPGLIIAGLGGDADVPNPATDFTILGRVSSYRHIWATASSSPFKTFDDLLAESKKRPIVAAVVEAGGTAFANFAITSHLLGIDLEYIAGFPGSKQASMSVVRGEVDVGSLGYESSLKLVESGDLRPLMQSSLDPIADHPSLKGVPVLGGSEGLAARRARELNRDVEEALADAGALDDIFSGGRLIAAPPGIGKDLFRCLEEALYETLTDPGFQAAAAKAKRSLDVARSAEALSGLKSGMGRADRFSTLVKQAIEKIRK